MDFILRPFAKSIPLDTRAPCVEGLIQWPRWLKRLTSFAIVALRKTMAQQPEQINVSSCFRTAPVPDLGLSPDLSSPYRVYVLRCQGGKFYVGLAPKTKVRARIGEQFAGKQEDGAAHFCAENKPVSVVCVWPAKDRSVEAGMFFGMLGALGISDFRKLGGWVFTSARPSPLIVMELEQCRRQLTDRCFDCNGGHYAGHPRCPGPNLDCWYRCVNCAHRNNISSRGQSTLFSTKSPNSQTEKPKRAAAPPPLPSKTLPIAKPSPPQRAVLPVSRKRSAAAILERVAPASSFERTWSSATVRKRGRYGCVKDFLKQMGTTKATRAMPTIGQRIKSWAKRNGWPVGTEVDLRAVELIVCAPPCKR